VSGLQIKGCDLKAESARFWGIVRGLCGIEREAERQRRRQRDRNTARPAALNSSEINLLSRYFCWSRLS